MKLFALNDDITALEGQLKTLRGVARAAPLVTLAWYLRQRDCARALGLSDEAEALLALAGATKNEHIMLSARLALVRAEVKMMFVDLTNARQLADSATKAYEELGDPIGLGDAHWLNASLLVDQGDGDGVDACIHLAIAQYRLAGDSLRLDAALGRSLVYAAFRDSTATASALEKMFPPNAKLAAPVLTWVGAARGNVAGLTGDPGSSIKHDLRAYQAALDSGQLRQALVAGTNAAESFATLGDLDAALQWTERALTLARSTGWPASVGVCLMQLGDVMRLLGRHDDARHHLLEALTLMEPLAGSRNYEQVVGNLGQLALDQEDYAGALNWFSKFEVQVAAHGEADMLTKAWRGQANALMHLQRPQEAKLKADAALTAAREQGNADGQIQVLSICARLHTDHDLPPPPGMTTPTAALHYLNQALELGSRISGYTAAPELFNQLASAYAACGEFRAAYENTLAANAARHATRNEEAHKRALAMRIRQEIEIAQTEAEHHRQLAETMKDMASTLETLGLVGREITASLNTDAVLLALHRHAGQLLDASFFAVYLLDQDQHSLTTAFGVEAGMALPVIHTPLDSPTSMYARCVRDRQEIFIDRENGANDPNLIPGTLPSLSLLYTPLIAGERLLGAMSVQSPRQHAYGEPERSIFRALCAYGAIALDNAAAYASAEASQRRADQALSELRHTQGQLLEQNRQLARLAVTDQLTGLYNRLRLDQSLEEERLRSVRYGTIFCLLILDVDHFKLVNDTFGHQTGDQVLADIARILQKNIREVDIVGRWGGEEFLVICPETTIEGALVVAENLRLAMQAHVFEQVGRKSASFGVAMFHASEALTETLARADTALYRAKREGRNRVENGEMTEPGKSLEYAGS